MIRALFICCKIIDDGREYYPILVSRSFEQQVLTSSESFPTSIRGQCLGFIAAFGKAGAAIGTAVFKPMLASFGDNAYKGNQAVFLVGSGFAVAEAITSWFIIPDISNRLENEDDAWKAYLKDQGYEIQWGDEETRDPAGLKVDAVKS
jgi:nitrate/nitrite transporter NarK